MSKAQDASAPKTAPAENGELKRSLSHGQMTMIAMGLALGTGLFLGSGSAIKIAGPGAIIAYAVGSMIAAIIAACAGEMAVRHPVPGGFGTIATRYLSPYAGYIGRWAYWATTVPLTGAELVAVGKYFSYWFPAIPLWVTVAASGILILILNLVSVKSFGALEFFLSSIKVIAVIVFIVLGLLLVFVGLPGHTAVGTANLVNDGGLLPNGLGAVWVSMAIVMFSFGGVEMLSISAAEAQNPARSVRTSVKAMIWRLSSFYVLSMLIILCLMPWQQAAQTGKDLSQSPFVMVFSELGIPYAADITNFVILIAALSGANASLYAATRLLHALAGDKMAPTFAGTTNHNGVPVTALMLSFLGVVALVTLCVLVVWIMILLTYQAYKKHQGNSSGFTVWGGRITAGVGLAGVLATLVALFMLPDSSAVVSVQVGVVFFAIISVFYVVLAKKRGGFPRADLDALAEQQKEDA